VTEEINKPTISDIESDALLVDLFVAASVNINPKEAGLFLSALLTPKELAFLSRRLRIAILLSLGYPYSTIKCVLHTGAQTISKVSSWLESKEENYQMVIRKLGEAGQINKILKSTPKPPPIMNPPKHVIRNSTAYSECFWPVEIISAVLRGFDVTDQEENCR
jgi:uncharacterized protein YerC